MTDERFNNWYDELPILAYGELSDEDLQLSMKIILEWKEQKLFISDKIPRTSELEEQFTVMEYWLILGLLDRCIEYGSSPRGAWLTDFGKDVLSYLRNKYD